MWVWECIDEFICLLKGIFEIVWKKNSPEFIIQLPKILSSKQREFTMVCT